MRAEWISLLLALVLIPISANAQSSQSQTDLERRLELLEQQVRDLRAEIVGLKAAPPSAGPTQPPQAVAGAPAPGQTAPSVPGGLAAAPSGGDQPAAAQLPVYGGQTAGRLLNPDVGIIGNFISATGESRGGSEAVAPAPFMTLQESEASFQAIVDPYARADFFLAIGEEGIEVEEGFVTFPAVPGGLLIKTGKFRANFGRLNAFHNHTLPWLDRPLVMYNLLGGATGDPDTGIKDAGVSVSRLIPAGNLFVEAMGEVFRGDSGTLFQASRRQDFSLVSRIRAYQDITESSNLEVGGSFARGHNDAGSDFLTRLYGAELTFRWKPLQRAIYRSFVARSEMIWSRREEPTVTHAAFGLYASADYQLRRRWFTGGRFDWAERAREASIRDRGFSAVLTYWPSEFSQVRGQYRRTRYGDRDAVANELLFQVLFTIGAHGAHAF
jgi:hypothetical protein